MRLASRILLIVLVIIGIGLVLVTVQPAKAVVVLSNLSSGDGTTSTIKENTRRAAGFTIPAGIDYTLNSVTLQLANIGSTTRTVIVEIHADLNSDPGEVIATLPLINLEANVTSASYITTVTSTLTLTAGKTYWIVVYASNNAQWIGSDPVQAPTGMFTFVGYQASSDGGTTWANSKNNQNKLYIDASAPGLPTNTVTITPTPSDTPMPSATPTSSPTRTPRNTATRLPTRTATSTPLVLATNTPIGTLVPASESTVEITGTTESTAEAQGTSECQVTTTVPLRLREGASTLSRTLAGVPKGVTLTVMDSASGWYQVSYQGIRGWISGDLVVKLGNCN